MKKSKLLLLAAYLFGVVSVLPQVSFAQKTTGTTLGTSAPRVRCAADEVKQQEIANDPSAQARYDAVEQQVQNWVNTHPAISKPKTNNGQPPIVTIPVVVHIVYNTAAQNISNTQVMSQIARLNLDFRKDNADTSLVRTAFKPLAGDAQIQFCLAVRDPNNNATTGIIHKSTTTTSFSTNDNVKHNSTGGDDAWNTSKYLNLWVCNMSGGILGYAQFPGGSAATDGVVIGWDCFGQGGSAAAPYDKGRTATHEIGHWLNLYHTFQGGCTGMTANNCATAGDNCCDTPPVATANYGCPASSTNTCNETYPSNRPDMTENYMDYTDDACMFMFSNDQINRMHACINTSRSGLLTSLGCVPLGPAPTASLLHSTRTICAGQTVVFTDTTSNTVATTFSWNFGSGATPATANTFGPHTVTFNTAGSIIVTYTASNSNGTVTKHDTITVSASPSPAIVGNAVACSNSTTAYTVTAATGNTYTWSVNGGTIASGQNTNTVNINWGNAGTGSVIIVQSNAGNCSRADTVLVTKQNAIAPVISGPATVCANSQKTYSIPTVANSTIVWSVTGGTITSGQGTNSVGVTWSSGTTGTITVSQTYYAGCVGTNTLTTTIIQAPTPSITGPIDACEGTSGSFTVSAMAGSSYNWLLTCSGCSITSGQGTNNATVLFNSAGSSQITVSQSINGCIGNSQVHFVTVHAKPTPSFTTTQSGLTIQFNNTTVGGTTYSWSFGDNHTDNTISPAHLYSTPGTYTVTLTATDAFNCSNTLTQTVVVMETGINELNANDLAVKLIPNPTHDALNIEIETPMVTTIKVTLTDVIGRELQTIYNGKSKTPVTALKANLAELPNSVYFIKVEGLSNPIIKKVMKN